MPTRVSGVCGGGQGHWGCVRGQQTLPEAQEQGGHALGARWGFTEARCSLTTSASY